MQSSRTQAGATPGGQPSIAVISSIRQLKLVGICFLLLLVWVYARFGGPQPMSQPIENSVGVFARARPFIATPGGGFAYINARQGPGTEYLVRQRINRGTRLMGVARRWDRDGAYWIELERGGGFVKESVLAPGNAVPML